MLLDILKQFNWLDILVVILSLRICYVAIKSGFLVEFFKILGTISAIYISFHYFTGLTDSINNRYSVKTFPLELLDLLFFIGLATTGYLLFMILRQIILRFIKMEAVPKLSRWGGFILGIARVSLFTSLIIFTLAISTVTYLKRSVESSYTGKYLFKIAPALYSSLWNGFFSRFMTKEKFNQAILEVQLSDSANE